MKPIARSLGGMGVCLAVQLALVAGCGESTSAGSDSGAGVTTDTAGQLGDSAGPDSATADGDDAGSDDAGSDGSGGDGAGEDIGTDDGSDGGGPVPTKPCAEPGAWGCACQGNADCNSGWCVATAEGKQCTIPCVEDCPSKDWICAEVKMPGMTDVTFACYPKHTTFCQPCAVDADCEHSGQALGATKCLVAGKDGIIQGSFCSSGCASDDDCAVGATCVDAATCKASGACSNAAADGKYCLPKDNAACTCSTVSKSTSAATACSVTTSAGTCQGSRTCGPEGLSACSAKTPQSELCNGQDDDCDGETDDGFFYDDLGSPKALGKLCGVGACIGGEVQCSPDGAGVVCTSNAKGKSEICDYVDNDCDGQTDEALTVADSPCLQKGVCTTKNVVATCDIGKWSCSYLAVDGYHKDKELACDGLDNDCDGEADEEFTYLPAGATVALAVGDACDGVGACGVGVVTCSADGKGAVCSTDAVGSASAATVETCDGQDNDCDGDTDEGCDDDKDGFCDASMGYDAAGALCGKGSGDCNDAVADIAPDVTETCDNIDNDCDAATDEGCDDDKDGFCDDAMVTTGLPAACTNGSGDCDDVAAAVHPSAQEACNTIDDDCDSKVDAADPDLGKVAPQCENQQGVCAGAVKPLALCAQGSWGACVDATYLAHHAGYASGADEAACDGLDNDCSGSVDDSCDKDGDGFCDAGKATTGTPQACAKGGADCNDGAPAVHPAAQEACNGIDDDCDKDVDAADADLAKVAPKCENQQGVCAGAIKPVALCADGAWAACSDQVYASHSSAFANVADEPSCDDLDNDCSGKADDGCDKDGDSYCDAAKTTAGKPQACGAGGGDCDDSEAKVHPAAQEVCNAIDDDCDKDIDAADADLAKVAPKCENQKGVCAGATKPVALCVKGKWGKCTDATYAGHSDTYLPGADEAVCDDLDNDCSGSTDDSCDVDQDNYCSGAKKTVGKPAVCPKGGGDCNDSSQAFSPGVKEVCDGSHDENCDGATDEENADSCASYYPDLDKDGAGDKFGQARCLCGPEAGTKYTAKVADDCNDKNDKVHPKAPETCATNDDDDCDGDSNDVDAISCTPFYKDGDGDNFGDKKVAPVCLCVAKPGDKLTATKGDDCDDAKPAVNPDKVESCLTTDDDDCSGSKNDPNAIGCSQWYPDVDKDTFGDKTASPTCLCVADAALSLTAKSATDCDDGDKAIKPGITDLCATKGVDDNCDGTTDPDNSVGCTTFYPDIDGDGHGDKYGIARCLCAADTTAKYTAKVADDCNDKNNKIHPKAKETCATNDDDDCNGDNNEVGAIGCSSFYKDGDGDGHGDKNVAPVCLCAAISGQKLTATKGGDCDDSKSAVHPDKVESCLTGDDDDCSGSLNDPNAIGCSQWYPDADKDGYGDKKASPTCLCAAVAGLNLTAKSATDCDDGNGNIKPGVTDSCATKGVDDNCDGFVDLDDSIGCKAYYLDVDGDTYGVNVSRCMCAADADKKYTASAAGDCNDGDPKIKPGATELCDGVNNDCDSQNLIDNGAAASCTKVANATLACVSAQCKIASCVSKWYDINGSYGDGCECAAGADYALGGSAGAAIDLGTFADNKSSKTYTGRFSPGETGRWFRFVASDGAEVSGCDTFNVQAALVNSHGNYIFDVYRGGASSGNLLCSNETVHEWKVDFYSTSPATGPGALPGGTWGAKAPSPSTKPSGECKCSTTTSSYSGGRSMPGMNYCVNNTATFYVYVKLKAGSAPFCADYNLYVRNGVK